MNYYIYKYVNEKNKIDYIGQTTDLKQRVFAHYQDEYGKEKIYYFECENKAQMDNYEYLLIRKYRPKYNKQFNETLANEMNIILIEPQWKEYINENFIKNNDNYLMNKNYKPLETLSHRGKPRADVDKELFIRINKMYENGTLTREEASKSLGIGLTTFGKIRRSYDAYFSDSSDIKIERPKSLRRKNGKSKIDKSIFYQLKNDYNHRKITKTEWAKQLNISRQGLYNILKDEEGYFNEDSN